MIENKHIFAMVLRALTLIMIAVLPYSVDARTYSVSDLPNVQVQDHTKHLVNPDHILSDEVGAQIDSLLLDARRQSSAEIVAVIVDDIDSDDIDTYATELFNTWRIGKSDKNNGILLIVAKDSRAATIRTGYGAEGILPDILSIRIINDIMIPYFRDGDYQGGMLAGVKELHRMVTDPAAAEELRSELEDNYQIDGGNVLHGYLVLAVIAAIGLMLWLLYMIYHIESHKPALTDYQKYNYLSKQQLKFWVIALIFVGIPILAPIILWLIKNHLRNHARICPHCHIKMKKLDEEKDNKYLSYAQDLEEKINSVDYDVWLCPKCGEKDILSYINNSSNYRECQLCHAHTVKLTGARILQEPTYKREGIGEKQYVCLNCQNKAAERYSIPKKEPPVVAVGGFGGGRGGGGFGGGSFGGGFGGGLTGGGGATGRW